MVWLALFRMVAVTLLLAATAARLLAEIPQSGDLSREDSLSFVLIGVVYAMNLVYAVLLRRGWVGRWAAYLQVLGDVVLASALVYVTGGVDSPYTFIYSLAVIGASILLSHRAAQLAAAVSSVAFGSLLIVIHTGILRPPAGSVASPSVGRLAFVLGSNVLAQFLIAALAAYLAKQLSAAGGTLVAREADLKKLAGLHRKILASMPSGLITCRPDGQVSFVNRAGLSILGLADAAAPQHIDALVPGVLRIARNARRVELPVQTPEGRRILGLSVTPLEDEEGMLLVFQDLTELRRMEDELRRSDHLAALGKLAAQLAHEIRNPLAAMRGSAQLLATDGGMDRTSARLADILVRESDRLSELVEEVLRFSRPPPPQLRVGPLHELVRETVEMLRADPLARGVEVEEALTPAQAAMDAGQLRQVVINLLRNAFAAVGPGGRVRVSVDTVEGGPRVRIWDSAGSIPVQDLDRIFEPFYTTREGGTGLGLSTAYSIIRAHGGMIQVSSSPEQGTEFVVGLLPAVEAARGESGSGEMSSPAPADAS
ncbi:MAG TPA: ATP-binding protein [Myxococcaceae bacterium]|nr:ATP-binding protein [Myxococcaceae bacterium]